MRMDLSAYHERKGKEMSEEITNLEVEAPEAAAEIATEAAAEVAKEAKSGGFGGRSFVTLITCIFLFLCMSGNGVVTPALNVMRTELWSDLPPSTVSFIATLPNLFGIAGALVGGYLAGRYLSWRAALVISFVMYLGFGIAPAVFNLTDFYTVLATRAGFGFGAGMLGPVANALILRIYDEQHGQLVLGWAQSMQSLGGVIMQMLGGFLAAMNPTYTFYAYFIAAIGLLFTFVGVPDLPLESKKGEKVEKAPIPAYCWLYLIVLGIGVMIVVSGLMLTSDIMAERGFGGSFGAGIVTSAYTAGGVCAGILFGPLFDKVKQWSVVIGCAVCAVSCITVAFATSAIMLFFGLFFAGVSFIMVRPAVYKIVSMDVTPAQMATMVGLGVAIFNLGTFFTSYYMKACSVFTGGVETTWCPPCVAGVIFAAMAVITAIYLTAKKKKVAAE